MHDGSAPLPIPSRPWRIIAEELSKENNPKRITELSQELNAALEEQTGRLYKAARDGHMPTRPMDKP